jgi:hypothetical protein
MRISNSHSAPVLNTVKYDLYSRILAHGISCMCLQFLRRLPTELSNKFTLWTVVPTTKYNSVATLHHLGLKSTNILFLILSTFELNFLSATRFYRLELYCQKSELSTVTNLKFKVPNVFYMLPVIHSICLNPSTDGTPCNSGKMLIILNILRYDHWHSNIDIRKRLQKFKIVRNGGTVKPPDTSFGRLLCPDINVINKCFVSRVTKAAKLRYFELP